MHFPAMEHPDTTLPPNAWNLQRIPGTTELPATHTGLARPCQPLLYCPQSSPAYSGAEAATSPSLSFHLLKAHLLKDVLYAGPQKPLSLPEGSGPETTRNEHSREGLAHEKPPQGAGCRSERHRVPRDFLFGETHTSNLLSSKWAGLYLHRKLDGNPPCKMSFFLTQKHLLFSMPS